MGFDFGAALTAAGGVTPALQQAGENQRQRSREQVLDQLKARELKEWVPVRSYASADGAKHTVYLTPNGYQDKVDEPSYGEQIQSKTDALRKVYKGEWTPEVEKEVISQLAGIKPTKEFTPFSGKAGEPTQDENDKKFYSWGTDAQGNTVRHLLEGYQPPQSASGPKLDWVDQYDEKTKQWFKVGYDKSTHEKVTALPETKVGFGITPTVTQTWNPQVGQWVPSYHMPSPASSFGTDGQASPQESPSPTVPPSMGAPPLRNPPGGTQPVIRKLAQPPKTPASPSGGAPPILRSPALGKDYRDKASAISSLQQQFMGEGNDPLWKYSKMLDNKPLARAINDALTASMQVMPTGSDNPGIGEALARVTGLTGLIQSKVSENIRKSREKVEQLGGDEALQLVDRLAELKGSVPVMRTISKASAAQASIAPLIQETPALNTSSSRDFTLRMAYTMRTLASALAADPIINPAYARWFFAQANEAEQAGKAKGGAPKTAEEYLSGVQ